MSATKASMEIFANRACARASAHLNILPLFALSRHSRSRGSRRKSKSLREQKTAGSRIKEHAVRIGSTLRKARET